MPNNTLVISWIDVKDRLPDEKESVIVKCPKMGKNGETVILVAHLDIADYWYSWFPYDQPVQPTHWCYSFNVENN